MSQVIDERIVEMRFDNEQFERGVHESISTINKLRGEMDFEGSANSFGKLSNATSSFASGIDEANSFLSLLRRQFSALEIVGITVLTRLTNKAIDMGSKIARQLLLDPITTGLDEYEQKMDNIQTTLVNSGESLEKVTQILDDMNLYADQTIYKFSDMTTALGKFTIAGISLDEAKLAIMGIGNAAAMSGLKAAQASSAYYMISQAYQSGVMRLYQFRTLENSGFASREFRQHLLDAGVAMGTLTKTANGLYSTVSKGSEVTIENMRDTLDELWVTKDVLNKVFTEYADDSTEFGQEAYKAAQQIKTASQLWDTLKEAAQSGWAKNWEYIIGDYYQAIELWGNINDVVSGALSKMSDTQAEVLKYWNQTKVYDPDENKFLSGRDYAIKSLANAFWSLMLVVKPISEAFHEIAGAFTGQTLTAFSKKMLDLSKSFAISLENAENLKNTFKGLFSIVGIAKEAFVQFHEYLFNNVWPLLSWIPEKILSITGTIGLAITRVYEFIKANGFIYTVMSGLDSLFQQIANNISRLFSKISNGIKNYEGLSKIGYILKEVIFTALDDIGGLFNKYFNIDISTGVESLKTALTSIGNVLKGLRNTIFDLIPGLGELFNNIGPTLRGLNATEKIAKIVEIAANAAFIIASGAVNLIIGVTRSIAKAFREFGLREFLDFILSGTLTTALAGFVSSLYNLLDPFGDIIDMIGDMRTELAYKLASIKLSSIYKIAAAVTMVAGSLYLLSRVDGKSLIMAVGALFFIVESIIQLNAITKGLTGTLDKSILSRLDLSLLSTAILKITASVLILAIGLRQIGKLNWSNMLSGLIGIETLLWSIVGMIAVLNKLQGFDNFTKSAGTIVKLKSNLTRTATAILGLAVAIDLLSIPILIFGKMKWYELAQGVIAIGSLFIIFSEFAKLTNGMDLKVTASALRTFSFAVLIMTASLGLLAAVNDKPILDAAMALGAVFGLFYIFTKATKGFDLSITAKALLTFSAAMLIMSFSIRNLAKVAQGTGLLDSMLALSALMMVFGMLVNNIRNADAATISASLLLFSFAVGIMAASLTVLSMAGVNAYLAAVSIATLITVVAILSELTRPKDMIALAGSLTLLGVAIGILSADLLMLSLVSTSSMLVSIVGLVAIIALLVKNSIALALAAPDIAIFGASLIPLGIACVLVSGSILMLSGAIYLLVAAVGEIVSVVTGSAVDLVKGLSIIFTSLGVPTFNDVGRSFGDAVVDGMGEAIVTGFKEFVKDPFGLTSLADDFVASLGFKPAAETGFAALKKDFENIKKYGLYTAEFGTADSNGILHRPGTGYISPYDGLWYESEEAAYAATGKRYETNPERPDWTYFSPDNMYNNEARKKARENARGAVESVFDAAFDATEEQTEELEDKTKNGMLSTLSESFSDLWDYISGKETDTSKMEKKTEKLMTVLGDVKDEFTARYGLNNALDTAKNAAKDLTDELQGELSGALGGIDSDAGSTAASLEDITKTINKQINVFEEFNRKSEKSAADYLKNMSSNALGVFDWASNISRLAMRGMDEGLLAELVNKGPDAYGMVAAFASATDEQIKQANTYYKNVQDSMNLAANQVKSSLDYSAQMTAKGYSEALENYIFAVDAAGITTSSMEDVEAAIKFNSDKLAEAARAAAAKALNTIKYVLNPRETYSVGENVTKGIANGIFAGSESLLNTVTSVSKKMITTTMYVLDEHSPSKVFEKIGRFVLDGLTNGIRSKENEPVDAMESLAYSTVDALNGIMNGEDLTYVPTITPVMDLSNIQNGANSINSLLSQREAIMASMSYQNNISAAHEAERMMQLNAIESSVNRIGESIVNAIISSSNEGVDVKVSVTPDSTGLFRMVRAEGTKFKRANGYNAFG